jgi:hypothetical protein
MGSPQGLLTDRVRRLHFPRAQGSRSRATIVSPLALYHQVVQMFCSLMLTYTGSQDAGWVPLSDKSAQTMSL